MIRKALVAALAAAVLGPAGCGVQPSGVLGGTRAPTGLAPGTPVYLVDDAGGLVVQRRGDGLSTIGQAVKMLLTTTRPGPGLHSYAGFSEVALELPITTAGEVITVGLPIDRDDVRREVGIDQLVCTALAVHQQSGGSPATGVRLSFVHGPDTETRHCPVLPFR
ncbi:GerMN domain-containing protein [Amycolatopsis nigrescens]|uniref:GerMN domain-containing protein n=1 Tax=Amycolatopsis nigrescens TaxID=381445 RepID=UPI0003700817|nr:GerMN domain-containing protein [Amycolatopsis nigrescens]